MIHHQELTVTIKLNYEFSLSYFKLNDLLFFMQYRQFNFSVVIRLDNISYTEKNINSSH